MNIIQAINDPNVFGPAFRNRDTWAAWFAFLAALFGLPMTPDQELIYTQCTERKEAGTGPVSEAWLVVGRRGGKSFILAVVAVFLAAFKDWRPYLGVGERGTITVIAADRSQARTIMRYVKGLLHLVPMLKQLIEAERVEGIDLSNRVTIEVHTASFRTTRGYTILASLMDEIGILAERGRQQQPRHGSRRRRQTGHGNRSRQPTVMRVFALQPERRVVGELHSLLRQGWAGVDLASRNEEDEPFGAAELH